MRLYIPENLDIDQIVYDYPPNFKKYKHKRDKLLYVIHLISIHYMIYILYYNYDIYIDAQDDVFENLLKINQFEIDIFLSIWCNLRFDLNKEYQLIYQIISNIISIH